MNDYSARYASILRDRSIGDDSAEDRLAAAWAQPTKMPTKLMPLGDLQ